MEFTGERYIHGVGLEAEIENEHIQRYISIAPLVRDKIVVDAASGAGYGAQILSESASFVCGVDIDPAAIKFSAQKFSAVNQKFIQGAIDNLPFLDKSVDIVVSFETIEHVTEDLQKAFVSEVKRILKDDGILIISTPDRHIYSDLPKYNNEFHVKEFYRDEFYNFLSYFFRDVSFYDQFSVLAYIVKHDNATELSIINSINNHIDGKYIIAICSDSNKNICINGTIIIDTENNHKNKIDRIDQLQEEIVDKNKSIFWLEGCVEHEKNNIIDINKVVVDKINIINDMADEINCLQQSEFKLRGELSAALVDVASLQGTISHIQSTRGWKILQKLYHLQNLIWPH